MRAPLAITLLVAGVLIGCGSSGNAPAGTPPATGEAVELTIFAAASLAGVLDIVKPAYEAAQPGTTLTISADSSAALETQIEQGAPADVFLSADTTNPHKLVQKGLSAGEAVVFASNELAIVVPSENPAGIRSPADLARPGVKVIAAGDEVPITRYANRLVGNLAKLPGSPADPTAAYARNVVSKEDNVKAVIGKIALGEGDAAIVYATDAKSAKVATIEIPTNANVRAKYAGVVVLASTHQELARTFLGWLIGPDGQAILAGLGFAPPTE
jgi:molybdate transport system substrate-binding protein